jgi:hypothetical protein
MAEPVLSRKDARFQTFAVFCMLYVFFWVIPRRRGITQKKTYKRKDDVFMPLN